MSSAGMGGGQATVSIPLWAAKLGAVGGFIFAVSYAAQIALSEPKLTVPLVLATSAIFGMAIVAGVIVSKRVKKRKAKTIE